MLLVIFKALVIFGAKSINARNDNMAKFLNTSGTTYHLEEMIKKAHDKLILISPYLQFNERMKELLEDKNRLKIDIRIVYGKTELAPQAIHWLQQLDFVRISFCKNLHAKCYLSENECIITSLNLYEFSQVNNHEMGVLIHKQDDQALYADAYDEVQRIVRISEPVNFSNTEHNNRLSAPSKDTQSADDTHKNRFDKITTARLAERLNLNVNDLTQILADNGYITIKDNNTFLTDKGKLAGGEIRKGKYGSFIVWSVDLDISFKDEKTSFTDKLLSLFKL